MLQRAVPGHGARLPRSSGPRPAGPRPQPGWALALCFAAGVQLCGLAHCGCLSAPTLTDMAIWSFHATYPLLPLCLLPVSPALPTTQFRTASSLSKPPSCVLSSSLHCAHSSADHAVQQDGQEFMKLFLTLLEARFSQQEELRDIIQARMPAQRGPQCSIPLCTQCRCGCNAAISACSHWCRVSWLHCCVKPTCAAECASRG